jgi:hypothetical protein
LLAKGEKGTHPKAPIQLTSALPNNILSIRVKPRDLGGEFNRDNGRTRYAQSHDRCISQGRRRDVRLRLQPVVSPDLVHERPDVPLRRAPRLRGHDPLPQRRDVLLQPPARLAVFHDPLDASPHLVPGDNAAAEPEPDAPEAGDVGAVDELVAGDGAAQQGHPVLDGLHGGVPATVREVAPDGGVAQNVLLRRPVHHLAEAAALGGEPGGEARPPRGVPLERPQKRAACGLQPQRELADLVRADGPDPAAERHVHHRPRPPRVQPRDAARVRAPHADALAAARFRALGQQRRPDREDTRAMLLPCCGFLLAGVLAREGVDKQPAEASCAVQGLQPEGEPRGLGGLVADDPRQLLGPQLHLRRQYLEASDHLILLLVVLLVRRDRYTFRSEISREDHHHIGKHTVRGRKPYVQTQ